MVLLFMISGFFRFFFRIGIEMYSTCYIILGDKSFILL
jgi:hypothetical protein